MTAEPGLAPYRPQRLEARHQTSAFNCGISALNVWLQRSALATQAKGVAVVDVWVESDRVLAYYALSPTAVAGADLPATASTGLNLIPGYLLGKLALDRTLHGRGLGESLLTQALSRVVDAADRGGGRLVVVDAINDAALEFYQHFDFIPIPGTMRLYMKVATIRATLG